MRRLLLPVGLVLVGLGADAEGASAQCDPNASGGLDRGGYNVGLNVPGCGGEGQVGAQSGEFATREVRAEPLLCPLTPDGLMEIIRYFDSTTGQLLRISENCLDPNVSAPALPPAPPSALEVFRSAPLPMPEVHVSPRVRGLVGLETWLWWGADTNVPPLSVAAGAWSASIEVRAAQIRWDLGNGEVVTAASAGTSRRDPSIRYVYPRQCDCTVTLTVEWSGVVTLTHPLAPAPIVEAVGPVAFSDSFAYPVEEREAVLVG